MNDDDAGTRYAVDPEQMFDLSLTTTVSELAAVPKADRRPDWDARLLGALWNGSVEIPDPSFFQGPDGFVYARLQLPRPGAAFQANCLARHAETLVSTARGAALFASPDAVDPVYVLPMGVLDSMLRFDDHRGDPVDRREVEEYPELAKDGEIRPGSDAMVGSPSRAYLPPATARALHRHLHEGWKIDDPRVALMATAASAPSRSLVIDRTIDEVPGTVDPAMVVRMLAWYLPPLRPILLRPPSMRIEDMARLADYFE
jgi:hypothetical protein